MKIYVKNETVHIEGTGELIITCKGAAVDISNNTSTIIENINVLGGPNLHFVGCYFKYSKFSLKILSFIDWFEMKFRFKKINCGPTIGVIA